MSNHYKKKYVIAVYTIVLCLSVFALVAGLSSNHPDWKSIWLNISTELIGVVLVFFIVRYIFTVDDWDLADKVKSLLDKLDKNGKCSADTFFIPQPDMSEYFLDTKSIHMCGFSLSHGLASSANICDCIVNGSIVRILLSDPTSVAIEMSAVRSELPDNPDHFRKRLENSLGNIEYILEKTKNTPEKRVKTKLLPFATNFALYILNKDLSSAEILVEIYTHKSGFKKHPWFKVTKLDDPLWFDFYSKHFDELWKSGKRWTPDSD